jgi:hypothetical protein
MKSFVLRILVAGCFGFATPALLALTTVAPAAYADDVSRPAILKAHSYLIAGKKGQEVLSFVHMFASYKGHELINSRNLGDGAFSLIYRYYWNDDDHTEIEFVCNPEGYVTGVNVLSSSALFQQPFLVSRSVVRALGAALLSAEGDKMSAADKAAIQRIIDRADTKALLEATLLMEQVF